MGGYDGQAILTLVSHLFHLLGNATESRSLAISSPNSYTTESASGKPQTRSISLTTGARLETFAWTLEPTISSLSDHLVEMHRKWPMAGCYFVLCKRGYLSMDCLPGIYRYQ